MPTPPAFDKLLASFCRRASMRLWLWLKFMRQPALQLPVTALQSIKSVAERTERIIYGTHLGSDKI